MTVPPGDGVPGPRLRVSLALQGGGLREDVLVSTEAGVTVADVAAALAASAGRAAAALYTRDTLLPLDALWQDVAPPDGSMVFLGEPPSRSNRRTRFELAVVAGPFAGTRVPLAEGVHTLGRGTAASIRIADPALSREHLVIEVGDEGPFVLDRASSNTTLIDGARLTGRSPISDDQVLAAGRNALAVRRTPGALPPSRRAPGSTRKVVQRPPRIRPAELPVQRLVSPRPPMPPARSRPSIVAILLPLVLSGVIVAVTGRLLYLLFAILSPAVAAANVVTDNRTRRRQGAAAQHGYQAALAEYETKLAAAVSYDAAQRRQRLPDLALVHAAATAPTALLWHRTRADEDFLHLRVGFASLPANVDLRDDAGTRVAPPLCAAVPVSLPLVAGSIVGISGDAEHRDALVRALFAQIATLHSPADVALHLLTSPDRIGQWDWFKWLPHALGEDRGAGRLPSTAVDDATAQRLVQDVLTDAQRVKVVLVDDSPALHGSAVVARLVNEAALSDVVVVVLANRFSRLPHSCTATVSIDPHTSGVAEVTWPGVPVQPEIQIDALSLEICEEIGRALAGWADPQTTPRELSEVSSGIPDSVGFLEAQGAVGLTPAQLVARWATPAGRVPMATCGIGVAGSVMMDLRNGKGGPHAFIAGTSGSGKSDFLRSMLTSLAMANGPDQLSMILIDFKNGSGLEALAGLPHVAAVVTNDQRPQLPRMLIALNADREIRQLRLKSAGYDSFDDYQSEDRGDFRPMSRLLVVVDEFAALRQSVPEAMEQLVHIVRLGRSAGMHLILSTQTVSSAVGPDILENTTLHVCLRVESEAESRNMIDRPDAARLSVDRVGRGFLSDSMSVREFQTGWLGHRAPARTARAVVELSPFSLGHAQSTVDPAVGQLEDTSTDMAHVLSLITGACALAGLDKAAPPWEPPLPDHLTLDTLTTLPGAALRQSELGAPVAMIDAPARRTREVWSVDLQRDGHLLVVGGSRSGKTSTLRLMACALAIKAAPDSLHLYVIEAAGRALSPLAALPCVGAVVQLSDPERVTRLVRMLLNQVSVRQETLVRRGFGSWAELREADPSVAASLVLMIDDFDALYDELSSDTGSSLLDDLIGLQRSGPGAGVHILATINGSKVYLRFAAAIAARLVLALPERSEYGEAGVARDAVPTDTPPPGRAVWTGTQESVQLALLPGGVTGREQTETVARIGDQLRSVWPADAPAPIPVPAWESSYPFSAPEPVSGHLVYLGVGGEVLAPVLLDLQRVAPALLVLGPRGSGRTNLLRTLAGQLTDGGGRPRCVLVSAKDDFPTVPGLETRAAGQTVTQHLAQVVESLGAPSVILVDDADKLLEGEEGKLLEQLAVLAATGGHVLIVAALTADAIAATKPWLARLKRSKNIVLLRPGRTEPGALGLAPMRPPEPSFAPGRGWLTLDGQPDRIMVFAAPL